MVTLSISLPDLMKEFIDREMAQHGHASADDYIQALLGREQKRLAKKELKALLLEGLNSPSKPVNAAFWETIRREVREGRQDQEHLI